MKIKKLEISGFKSFVDKTVLHFDHEITGIVGPNGCGKSNVVDAIRWAMGEQSAKHLRGKAMEDVIFNGSESRGPHGFAEVSIVFDNSDGLAPPEFRDYAEVAVTRRLDRQGRSDYFINRSPARLMDVTNLFLGTGVGKRAYSIIEQGRIGYIVSSKPEDRRGIIEEAAGITKFKARRRIAERKMEQTRQNLLRINDIVREIEKSLSSLQRQAQKAERYKKYRAEVRDLELLVASHRWLELTVTERVVRDELEKATAKEQGARLGLRVREAELEADRIKLRGVESRVEQAQNHAYECDNQVRLLESEIRQRQERLTGLIDSERLAERELGELRGQRQVLEAEASSISAALDSLTQVERDEASVLKTETEEFDRRRTASQQAQAVVSENLSRVQEAETRRARADAVLGSFERRCAESRGRLERVQNEAAALATRTEGLTHDREELELRVEELRRGHAQAAARRDELEAARQQLSELSQQTEKELDRLRAVVTSKRSRLRSLTEIHDRFEGLGSAVRKLLSADTSGHEGPLGRGVLADRFECSDDLVTALAAALGHRLEYVVVDSLEEATQALDWLRGANVGRATLIPQRPRHTPGASTPSLQGEGVIGPLVDRIGCAPDDRDLVEHMLRDFVLVRDWETALRIHTELRPEVAVVTLTGEVLSPDGRITAGSGDDAGTHLLEIKREIRQLEGEVAGLDDELTKLVQRHNQLREDLVARQVDLEASRGAAHEADLAIVRAEQDVQRAEDEVRRNAERQQVLEREAAELSEGLATAADEESDARREVADAEVAQGRASELLRESELILGERQKSVEQQQARVTDVRVRAARAKEKADSERAAHERLARSVQELNAREQRLVGDVRQGAKQQGGILGRLMLAREELAEGVRVAMVAQDQLTALRARYDQERYILGESEAELKGLRSLLEERAALVSEKTLRERELALAMEHLLEEVEQRHRVDLTRIIGDYHFRDIPDDTVRSRIDDLLRIIERMGEINLTAIEDYQKQSERHEYLKGQQTDLESALEQLERAIRQMNRESRRMFQEAFVAINKRFKVVFPQMFGGGRAELRMTDSDDVLECGIDIIAQPPGKRLGSLELMSGGEKALTAVSLIFALFQYKPSPFCLLDEVDAPLDEANIGRFAEAIAQMTERSQFIVITHAKRTMEFADILYGVTMEEPGVSKLVAVELRGGRRPTQGPITQRPAAVA